MQHFLSSNYSNAENLSTKDLRADLASVIDRVAMRGETFIITKFGTPRALITPFIATEDKSATSVKKALDKARGMWQDRSSSTLALARQLRLRSERRD